MFAGKRDTGIFQCNFCGKIMQNRTNMEMHVRVHTGEKPFYCEICGKTFRQKVHLRAHTIVHKTSERDKLK